MSDRPIVVFGARGFVGAALVRHCLKMGRPVLAIGRTPPPSSGAQFQYIEMPSFEHDALVPVLRGSAIVINCAGKTGAGSALQQAAVHQANAALPVALYEAACAARVEQFVHISSVAAIRSVTDPRRPAKDDDIPMPSGDYGKTKLIGDSLLEAATGSTELLILRPPILYDLGVSGIFGLLLRCARFGLPLPFANLQNVRNFMFVGNLADALLTATDHGAKGSFLVTDGPAIRIDDLYSAMCRIAGRHHLSYPVPMPLMRALAAMILRSRAQSLLADAAYDDHRFRTVAGWSPRYDLMQALRLSMVPPTASMESDT